MKQKSASKMSAFAIQVLCLLLSPAASQAGKPLENCPVNILTMVEVCDGDGKNCTWKNYCAYLGYGENVDDDPDPFEPWIVAPVSCVDLCNRQHGSLQARETCYESCGIPPRSLAFILRIPSPPPACGRRQAGHGMPRPAETGPVGICPSSVGLFAGSADLTDGAASPGLSIGLSLEYRLSNAFALELFVGQSEVDRGLELPELSIDYLSLGAKYFLREGRTRPFIRFGLGLYDLDPGQTENGLNGGVGVAYAVTNRADLEFAATYHAIDSGETEVDFIDLKVGWRFHF